MPPRSKNLSRRSFVIAGACLAAGVLAGCNSEEVAEDPAKYVSPYDWSGLMYDGQRLDYFENDTVVSQWGIDVSEHQGEINWQAVATTTVQYVFVRIGNRGATAGALDTDDFFQANALGAAKAGIPLSAYFFSQSLTEDEAREEAEFALNALRVMEVQGVSFQYVAYDHEMVQIDGARANDLTPEQFSANAKAFCEVVAKNGYEPMIYGNQADLLRLTPEVRRTYPLWLAEYDVMAPTAPFDFALWQYSNAGIVPGIEHPVDLNLWLNPK